MILHRIRTAWAAAMQPALVLNIEDTPEMRLRRAVAQNLAAQAQRQAKGTQRALRTRRAKG